MMSGWIDKTWWFCDEEGKIIFAIIIEHPQDKTPPNDLVELIDLYQKGYRIKE